MSTKAQIDWAKVSTILVHKPDHIGDLLCAAPALALVRKAAPSAKITVAFMPKAAQFLEYLNLYDEIHPLLGPTWYAKPGALRYIRWARRKQFDLIVNFRCDFRDILATQACGAKLTCTWDHKGLATFAAFKTKVSPDLCETDNHLRLARAMELEPAGEYRAKIRDSDAEFIKQRFSDAKKRIAFHPFAASPAKKWPLAHIMETVGALLGNDMAVALIGSEENSRDAQLIAKAHPGIVNLVGQTSPGQLFAAVAAADLLIAADSGPGHIGPLVDTPVVSLMSGTNEAKRWAPKGATVIREGASCAPCGKRVCPIAGHPCMSGISPGRVIDTVIEVLRS